MNVAIALWPRDEFEWLELALESIESISMTPIGVVENEPLHQCDVMLFDGDSPGPYFFQYLTRLVESGQVGSMVVLGDPTSVVMRALDWEQADVVFVTKPYQIENVKQAVIEKLKESKRLCFEKSMREEVHEKAKPLGYLSTLRLSDLVQMLCLSQWTGQIHVEHLFSGEVGNLYLNVGVLIHASCDHFVAEEAFYQMLTWGRCEFRFIEEHLPVIQTIKAPWQELLLEGARLLDEQEGLRVQSEHM